MSNIVARRLDATQLPSWEALVAASPDGSVYALPAYLEVLADVTGAQWYILGAWSGERLLGGLPVFVRRMPFGRYVAPRLLLYYNGFVLKQKESRYPSERTSESIKVVDALESALRECRLAHVTLRSRSSFTDVRPLLARAWTAEPSWTYVVDLTDIEQAHSLVESNYRRLVRRCDRDGFTLSEDADFERFYALHQLTRERKGTNIYLPRDQFETYFTRLRQAGLARLYHARTKSGESVAAQLVLLGHPVTHSVCAGADPEWMRSGASVFLRWRVCEALAAEGFEANDLTDATLNPVSRFKSQLGADLQLSMVAHRTSMLARELGSAVQNPYEFAGRIRSAAVRRLAGKGR